MAYRSSKRVLTSLSLCLGLAACGGSGGDADEFTTPGTSQADAAVNAGGTGTTGSAGSGGTGTTGSAGSGSSGNGSTGTGTTGTGTGSGTAGAGAAGATGGKPDAGIGAPDAGGGSEAGAAQPDSGTTTLAAWKPKCVKKDSQVMVVGDSYINWISHDFPNQLKTATKMDWRMLAVGGYAMGSGGIGSIPGEFDESIAQDPDAHTVLMDGGGNDILVPDLSYDNFLFAACKEEGSSKNPMCQAIVKKAIDTADMMLDRAVAKGIRDVVYFFYPHIPEGRLIGGPHPNEILDYALPMVESFCNGALERSKGKLRCTFISMIDVFKGHTPDFPGDPVKPAAHSEADWFNDDIHPNEKGSQAMVNKIWEVMQAKCIGQKDKDCCEP